MKKVHGFTAVALVMAALLMDGCKAPPTDSDRLQGIWEGRLLNGEDEKVRVIFSEDRVEVQLVEQQQQMKGTYILDEERMPRQINITVPGGIEPDQPEYDRTTGKGIYLLEDNMLTFASDEFGGPTRASSFVTAGRTYAFQLVRQPVNDGSPN